MCLMPVLSARESVRCSVLGRSLIFHPASILPVRSLAAETSASRRADVTGDLLGEIQAGLRHGLVSGGDQVEMIGRDSGAWEATSSALCGTQGQRGIGDGLPWYSCTTPMMATPTVASPKRASCQLPSRSRTTKLVPTIAGLWRRGFCHHLLTVNGRAPRTQVMHPTGLVLWVLGCGAVPGAVLSALVLGFWGCGVWVGVDLCVVGGVCRVVRVAAADAERLRPTP